MNERGGGFDMVGMGGMKTSHVCGGGMYVPFRCWKRKFSLGKEIISCKSNRKPFLSWPFLIPLYFNKVNLSVKRQGNTDAWYWGYKGYGWIWTWIKGKLFVNGAKSLMTFYVVQSFCDWTYQRPIETSAYSQGTSNKLGEQENLSFATPWVTLSKLTAIKLNIASFPLNSL